MRLNPGMELRDIVENGSLTLYQIKFHSAEYFHINHIVDAGNNVFETRKERDRFMSYGNVGHIPIKLADYYLTCDEFQLNQMQGGWYRLPGMTFDVTDWCFDVLGNSVDDPEYFI